MIWTAVIMVIGQGTIIGTLFYFIRTFGSYTEALLRAHESNLVARADTVRLLNALYEQRTPPHQEVA